MSDPSDAPADIARPDGRAVDVCRAFVDAIAWGEHKTVWELLAPEGRKTVLRVGTARGMDEALVMRLRDGTASPAEQEAFLTDLVNGLRADLEGNPLDLLDYELDPTAVLGPGAARVVMTVPLPDTLAAGGTLPAGWFDLSCDDGGRWRVERLVPRPPAR